MIVISHQIHVLTKSVDLGENACPEIKGERNAFACKLVPMRKTFVDGYFEISSSFLPSYLLALSINTTYLLHPQVCSNYNETWISDCELYRTRCLCDEASPDCINPMNKHLHIDYYGECREMPVSAKFY